VRGLVANRTSGLDNATWDPVGEPGEFGHMEPAGNEYRASPPKRERPKIWTTPGECQAGAASVSSVSSSSVSSPSSVVSAATASRMRATASAAVITLLLN